ncbi:MAG: glycosyltransferase family 4 protein [Candidatus Portnoybacteria bacterium]|nr:glycosyltransferase family 4 protein [Candidatus Portnoybacteria bacterium]
MRILMISTDRTLLSAESGDAFERHLEYARRAGKLDIIVFSKKGFGKTIRGSLAVYPTNSTVKLNYIWDAFQIAKNIYFPDRFDLIVCQDPFLTGLTGWLLKKRFKTPLLIHFHGDFWENKNWLNKPKKWWHLFWYNWLLLLLSKFLVDGADGIRVVSAGIKDKLVRADVPKDKIRVISTPVDLEKFEKGDEKKVEELRLKNKNYKTIINIGLRDASAKDYPTLFKTINLVHEKYGNLAFCQIGAGICLQDRTKESENLILTCVGEINQKELINYYHSSDVYVSSSCNESFGKVLIEAMAAGLPVVATTTTGSKEIVVDGVNGFLVPVGDSVALAKKILFLLNNSEKAREIGEAGRKMVKERFGKEKIIGEMIGFWKELTK